MRLYVYNTETEEPYEIVATVDGTSNEQIERCARDNLLETNEYGWSYTDGEGSNEALVETERTKHYDAEEHDAEIVRQAIEDSGLSVNAWSQQVTLRESRTVRRWLAGDSPVPQAVIEELRRRKESA